jgi:hypothetical protein
MGPIDQDLLDRIDRARTRMRRRERLRRIACLLVLGLWR